MMIRLIPLSGAQHGTAVPINRFPYTIGRSPECHLPLSHGAVSKRHCSLDQRPDGLFIRDLGSTNGTFLSGERLIPYTDAELRSGDELRLGSLMFRVEIDGAARVAPRARPSRDEFELDDSPAAPPGGAGATMILSRPMAAMAPTSPKPAKGAFAADGQWHPVAEGGSVELMIVGGIGIAKPARVDEATVPALRAEFDLILHRGEPKRLILDLRGLKDVTPAVVNWLWSLQVGLLKLGGKLKLCQVPAPQRKALGASGLAAEVPIFDLPGQARLSPW